MNTFETTISAFDGRSDMAVILKRPSLLTLAKLGKIPNPLLGAATRLFDFAPKGDGVNIKEIGEILHILAEATLVKPAYAEIADALTDRQLMEIYHYVREGADGLEYFRRLGGVSSHSDGGSNLGQECQ